jgi:hypothetical protein
MPVLATWRGIAKYMGTGIRTVQRWEIQFGLPVRRNDAEQPKLQVTGVPAELDEWVKTFPLRYGLLSVPGPEVGELLETIFQLQADIQELRRQLDQRRVERS